MTTQETQVEKLSWDSSFFEKDIFKVSSSSYAEIKKAIQGIAGPAMFYIFSEKEIPDLKHQLMDTKLTFEKILTKESAQSKPNDSVVLFDGKNAKIGQLEDLAVVSSQYSRFRRDPKILPSKTDEMFRLWIRKAMQDLNNHAIVIKQIQDTTAGMISIKTQSRTSIIELVSVATEFHRQGIADEMMEACLSKVRRLGSEKIQVVTQQENPAACKLYGKHGFQVIDRKYIYHLHKGLNVNEPI